MENMSPSSSLKILCFGDSLTAGYSRFGMLHYPYSEYLRGRLQAAFPSMDIHIDVEGMSGAQVQGQYMGRLNRACVKAKDGFYDWIIVMGGTNDLGWGRKPEDIYEDLKKVWDLALDHSANVLALNVIECAASIGTIVQRRNRLNELIGSHSQDRWHPMDLCTAVPYFSIDDAKQELIWDDGLHLTKDGYEMMGNAIAAHLIELLKTSNDAKNKVPSDV